MKQSLLPLLLCALFLTSCKVYLDNERNTINADYMSFKYGKKYNELDYFSKVNASAGTQTFYTTHFTVRLPKGIVYWKQYGNKFYYEYDSKQVIYIYSAYKNEGQESEKWELKDIDEGSELKYLEDYWKGRNYNENFLAQRKKNRVTKLYTNGKYDILLYNIREKNFSSFLDFIKTFLVKE